MPAYVITLEPEKVLFDRIVEIKEIAKELCGPQTYLEDEPHITLYIAQCKDRMEWQHLLQKYAEKIGQQVLRITDWHVFENDMGRTKHTLTCSLHKKNHEALKKIQMDVIKIISPYREKRIIKRYEKKEWKGILKENLKRYGFPFVGEIYHPHIGIAAFDKDIFPGNSIL